MNKNQLPKLRILGLSKRIIIISELYDQSQKSMHLYQVLVELTEVIEFKYINND